MDDLSGKVALVTGAGSGIGRGIALACADEGMHVVLADVQAGTAQAVAAEVEAKEVRALAVDLDVRNAATYESVAERIYAEFGELNLLVNNAGVMTSGPVSQGDPGRLGLDIQRQPVRRDQRCANAPPAHASTGW